MKRSLYSLIALGVLYFDLWTKHLIEENFSLYSFKTIIPGLLELTHTRNTGMAFGVLSDFASPQLPYILSAVSMIAFLLILTFAWYSPVSKHRLQIGLMLVLGGAAGNLYDRLTHGFVTDFIDVAYKSYHWPTFNVADSAITIGMGFLLFEILKQESSASKKTTPVVP